MPITFNQITHQVSFGTISSKKINEGFKTHEATIQRMSENYGTREAFFTYLDNLAEDKKTHIHYDYQDKGKPKYNKTVANKIFRSVRPLLKKSHYVSIVKEYEKTIDKGIEEKEQDIAQQIADLNTLKNNKEDAVIRLASEYYDLQLTLLQTKINTCVRK